MRILYEVIHVGVDYGVLTSGASYIVPGVAWDECERPRPDGVMFVPHDWDGDFDVAVVGTMGGFRRYAGRGRPMIYRQYVDFGRWRMGSELLDRVDVVVAVNVEGLRRYGLHGGHPKGIVIEHAIDTSVFCGYSGGIHDVLFVGNKIPDRPEKGPEVLKWVDAVRRVDLMGWGNEGYRHWIGRSRSREHLADTYRAYKVYFNPSPVICTSVLEAMATGMPVVTMRPGNFVDLMEHGRNCLVAESPQDALLMIERLLDRPEERMRIGSAAREDVARRFHPDIAHAKWNALFECITEKVGI